MKGSPTEDPESASTWKASRTKSYNYVLALVRSGGRGFPGECFLLSLSLSLEEIIGPPAPKAGLLGAHKCL